MKKLLTLVTLISISSLVLAAEVPPVSALQLTGKTISILHLWKVYLRDLPVEYQNQGWGMSKKENYTPDENPLANNLSVKVILKDNTLTSKYQPDSFFTLVANKNNLSNEEIAHIKANKNFVYTINNWGSSPTNADLVVDYATYNCDTTGDNLEKCQW